MNKKVFVPLSVIVGVVFMIVAVTYFMHPANTLPAFLLGYDASSTRIHFKHGLGSVILALALFAYAWFKSGETLSDK